jgi:ankyrin repeat protein
MDERGDAQSLRIASLVWSREAAAVKELTTIGQDALSLPTLDGKYPLEIAIEMGPPEKIEALLVAGVNPDLTSTSVTPLMHLLRNKPLLWDESGDKRAHVINLLLDFGANYLKNDLLGATPTDYAWESGLGTTFTRILLIRGIEPKLPSAPVRFISAVVLGQIIQADTLLRLDVSINTRMKSDDEGKTALMIASKKGDYEMLHLLLAHKADISIKTQLNWRKRRLLTCSPAELKLFNEKTALYFAVDRGKLPVIKTLLSHMKDKKTGIAEECPLRNAINLGRDDIVDTLKFSGYRGKDTVVVGEKQVINLH